MTRDVPNAQIYQISVEGHLGDLYREIFDGLALRWAFDSETGAPITVLSGPVIDQSALHGILARIRDLNINLLSVQTKRSLE